jgi:hypothetical protein
MTSNPRLQRRTTVGAAVFVGAGAVAASVGGLQASRRTHVKMRHNIWIVGVDDICGIGVLIAVTAIEVKLLRFIVGLFRAHSPATPDDSRPNPINVYDVTVNRIVCSIPPSSFVTS